MKYDVKYVEYRSLWKIAKVKEGYLILNHLDEEIDIFDGFGAEKNTFESFDDAYSYVHKFKDCK